MFQPLHEEARRLGKPAWRGLLGYVSALHERSVHPPQPPLPHAWEEVGPGYCYAPAFGHWDIVHAAFDSLPVLPEHVRLQLLNHLATQREDGSFPVALFMRPGGLDQPEHATHPPMWPVAVEDWESAHGPSELLDAAARALERLITWFEKHRRVAAGGFYYLDVISRLFESGVDDGIRFTPMLDAPAACVDATAHLYQLYGYASAWAQRQGDTARAARHADEAEALKRFMQEQLFDAQTGLFHDAWAMASPGPRPLAFEGMWPMVVGAASASQAQRVIDDNLLHPERFFTAHPIATVSPADSRFELRMWRGPTWNSMTWWAARGCLRYGRPDAAALLLERALDASAQQFDATGAIWEFYHPHGGSPLDLARKPYTNFNQPSRDYLGHNPLLAMARLWEQARSTRGDAS